MKIYQKFIMTAVLFGLFFSFCACSSAVEKIVPAVAPVLPKSVTLIAAGDNILHNTVYNSAKTAEGYRFQAMYDSVEPIISAADIAFINQEAPMSSLHEPSSYPTFNSPQEIATDLLAVGFDVFNLANNHMMDKGVKGVLSTLNYLDTLPVHIIGAFASEESRKQPVILTKNGVTVGFLGYTYGTNGITIPKDKPYLVGLIDDDILRTEVSALRSQCDFLIVSMHWGDEYHHQPNDEQKRLAQLLAELNVDVVIGSHPHVIQPMEYLTSANGHRTLVVYSLGNFISSQNKVDTMLGGLLYVKLTKASDGYCFIAQSGLLPTVTHYDNSYHEFKIYPLDNYNESLSKKHRLFIKGQTLLNPTYLQQLAQEIWRDNIIGFDELSNKFAPINVEPLV